MKESTKYEKIKATLETVPATMRSQRLKKDAILANLDRMIAMHLKKELAQEAKV